MMKGFGLICVLLLSACSTLRKPYLYEARKPSNTFYVFGTVHIGVPIQDLPLSVMNRFDDSQTFDMEVNLHNYETEQAFEKEVATRKKESMALLKSLHQKNPHQAKSLGKILVLDYQRSKEALPEAPKKLSQRLTPTAWQYVHEYFKDADVSVLEQVSPDTISYILTEAHPPMVKASKSFFTRMDPKYSMDLNLLSRARDQRKSVYQLDDTEVLSPECSDLSESEKIIGVFKNRDANAILERYKNLERLYRSGDENGMIAFQAHEMSPALDVCLLDERNQKWVPRIIADSEGAAMRGQPPMFVAVGVAHLFGNGGLLALLKKEGYSIQRVEP